MEQHNGSHSNKRLQLAFICMLSVMITIVAVNGWISNRNNYLELKSEKDSRELLLPAASRQALSGIPADIVGEPIEDYPLIQVLGTQSTASPHYYVDEWQQNRKRRNYTFPDVYGNEPMHWERIGQSSDLIIYFLVLGTDDAFADSEFGVGVVVEDGIIRLIFEFSGGMYHGADSVHAFFDG